MNLARFVFVAILALASNAAAQTSAISGRVADPQGAVVVGAEIVLRGADTPRTLSTRSASDGTFAFEQVPPGRYLLQVEAPGFLRWTQEVTAGSSALTVTLRVAGVNEDITVVGAAGLNLSRPSPTASRLDLTPMQTPGSVHVMTGELIRARGDAAISEATTRAVGMTTNWTVGNGGGGLTTRGFGGPGSILQLYDGVQLFIGAHTESFPVDTWSVDRNEVLGGPRSVQ
jgi:hypothetical protein